MKVLHLIDHLGSGGSQVLLADQVEARDRNVRASVWCLRERSVPGVAERLRAAGAPPLDLKIDLLHPHRMLAVRRVLATENPDILHTHLDYASVVGPALAMTLGSRRPAVLLHLENDPFMQFSVGNRWLIGRLARRVELVVAVSEGVRRRAEAAFSGARRMVVVRPGIDLQRFRRESADRRMVAALRGSHHHVVGTVARLAEQKSVHILLDAGSHLIGEGVDLRIVIVGDGPLRGALEGRAARLGIEQRVSFLGYRDDVVTAYAAMDVFVLPSKFEGYGLTFLEAMAVGVPVVGTRVIGSEEAVQEGRTGLLVPTGDALALADAVRRLLDDPGLAKDLAQRARDWVTREGSRDRMVSRIEALYADIADERLRRIGRTVGRA